MKFILIGTMIARVVLIVACLTGGVRAAAASFELCFFNQTNETISIAKITITSWLLRQKTETGPFVFSPMTLNSIWFSKVPKNIAWQLVGSDHTYACDKIQKAKNLLVRLNKSADGAIVFGVEQDVDVAEVARAVVASSSERRGSGGAVPAVGAVVAAACTDAVVSDDQVAIGIAHDSPDSPDDGDYVVVPSDSPDGFVRVPTPGD